MYLDGALHTGLHTAITLLRGVCNLKTLSFYADVHDARVFEWKPELDHLIISCNNVMSLEPFQSLLPSLASHSTAYSLTKIGVGIWHPEPLIVQALSTDIESWEKHQFSKLRFVSIHVSDNRSEGMTSAIADLMRVGADKRIEIDVTSSPLPTVTPFESW